MIKVKAIDLITIAFVAHTNLMLMNARQKNLFKEEEEAAKMIRKKLSKVNWDEDAELIIDEAPF